MKEDSEERKSSWVVAVVERVEPTVLKEGK